MKLVVQKVKKASVTSEETVTGQINKGYMVLVGIKNVGGELLLVSQFTLYGDATQGNRPSFIEAARPEQANELYEYFCNQCAKEIKVEKGVFQTHMEVSLVNDGPVTIILEK